MKRIYSVLIILLCLSSPVFADETVIEEKIENGNDEFNEIVVSATRYEELLSNVPANVTIISKEELNNATAKNIPDVLRNVTGIHINDISGNGRTYTVDLRGFGETATLNTLVLVDGRRINQADLSGTDWSQIPLDRVERIEIIRGGRGSVLYGDNASGGVVNIITKKGDQFKGDAQMSAGSYDTFKTNAFLGGSKNDLSYAFSGSYLSSEGYRDNSETEAKDFGVNLNYYLNNSVNLNLSSGYHQDSTGLPGALRESDFSSGSSRTDTTNPSDFADIEDYYVKATPEIYFGDNTSFKIDASFRNRESSSFASFFGGTFTGNTTIKTITFSPQVLLKNKIGKFSNILTIGFDYQDAKEDILNNSSFSGIAEFELEKESYGFYIHDDIRPVSNLLFSGGYRYDKADFTFAPSTPNNTATEEHAFTAGVNYSFLKKSYLYLSYSRSFRYPVLDEFFSFFQNTIDTSLTPQRSDDYEFGIRHYLNNGSYVHINFFRTNTKDEILFNPLSGLFGANVNLDGTTRRDGVEISAESNVSDWLSLKAGYSYLKATIDGGQFSDNNFPGTPKNQATLNAVFYPIKDLSVAINGYFIGKRPFIGDFSNAFEDQKRHLVFDAKLKYKWKAFILFLDLNNIFNEEYSEYSVKATSPNEKAFYPSPTFNFIIGMSTVF